MAHQATGSLGRQLESLFDGSSIAGLSDGELLERFIAQCEAAGETAFAALVARHGPMVAGICRQLLGDVHHAEDAFQAVCLVLARKAPSIHHTDRLANWLYGVALRTARKAKVRLAWQRPYGENDAMSGAGPGTPVDLTVPSAEQSAMAREQADALHDEIARPPGSFRLPIVLCVFEGLTLDEAARQLLMR
jgi:RNA polymerase sigma factor (sigma-70 family)